MSSCDGGRMMNSESLEFPMKSETEDSLPLCAVKLENNYLVSSVSLFNDGSLFMDPDIEFKADPEVFESSEGKVKYFYDFDATVSEEDLQSCKEEINKEEESVKTYLRTGVKEEWGKGEVSEEVDQIKQEIINSSCEKPLCQENDPKTHTDDGIREKSSVCRNYEKQLSGVVNPNTHMLIHTEGKAKCRECGKVFFTKSHLKVHFRIHTGEKPFKCDVCDKAFPQKYDLTKHYRIHTGEKPFKCDVCDKAFPQKYDLTKHYRVHTGEKPFKCSVCDKAFSQRGGLTLHYRIHTGEKRFSCPECPCYFSISRNLKVHMRTHTGEKPFLCPMCPSRFSHSTNLKYHITTHTGAPSPRAIQRVPQVANGGTPSL